MELKIYKPDPTALHEIWRFYQELIETTPAELSLSKWEKEIYPAFDFLQNAISAGELYIAKLHGEIVSAMVLNHRGGAAYQTAPWSICVKDDEVTVIHTLGVMPKHSGRGIAKEMVKYALCTAKEAGQAAVRLDVLAGNTPAEHLYPSLGFSIVDTVKLYYDNTGWHDFILMEYNL